MWCEGKWEQVEVKLRAGGTRSSESGPFGASKAGSFFDAKSIDTERRGHYRNELHGGYLGSIYDKLLSYSKKTTGKRSKNGASEGWARVSDTKGEGFKDCLESRKEMLRMV